ncbi:MAG: hypothetical protein CMJ58_23570 [Planctomycetaceae bacterium]|nr:hypothetical protein [Planctomycetaceae bacterium]
MWPTVGCAIVLNDDYFQANGGDPNQLTATLDDGYGEARQASFAPHLLAVGTIGQCTATWIGNDAVNDKSYYILAAHCLPDDALRSAVTETFTDWQGNLVASGAGAVHVPPERVDRPAGYGGASTDISILELPGLAAIRDDQGELIAPPLIYDGDEELGAVTTLAGYGSWGLGSTGSDGSLLPATGARRAAGNNVISAIIEQDHGVVAAFDAPGSDGALPTEAAVASGDSGSAWWQRHRDRWAIIATTNGGSGTTYGAISTGARVSQYADWIVSIYPDAQLWSQAVPAGDFDDDGDLDAADWRVLRSGLFTDMGDATPGEARLLGDMNGDLVIDERDFTLFKNRYAQVNGAAAWAALHAATVPEPSSAALVSLLLIAAAQSWPRRDRQPPKATH